MMGTELLRFSETVVFAAMTLPNVGQVVGIAACYCGPIAAGENEYTRYGFRDLIDHRSASILNPDAQFVGGVTEFMKVAALAQAHDLPIARGDRPDVLLKPLIQRERVGRGVAIHLL